MDADLIRAVSTPACSGYPDVLAKLSAIEAALHESDGLLWFTRLYRAMTQAVADSARGGAFQDPKFLEVLDCRFAELYFQAIGAYLTTPSSAPRAWTPLFEARGDACLTRLQFAVAGVNAHINRDLPVALVTAFRQRGVDPERGDARYTDYVHINRILADVHESAKKFLITGTLAAADLLLGSADDVLEIWSLERARDAAWVAGEVQWQLRALPILATQQLGVLDKLVGCTSRALLRPGLRTVAV